MSPRSYEHPADRAATSALHAIPLFDRLIKRFGALGVETRFRQLLLGDAVQLGTDQLPDIWAAHVRAASVLDVSPPPLFVSQIPTMNALTFGMRSPVVLTTSSLVRDYEPDELETVLAHELGHVLSDHVTYSTALAILTLVSTGLLSSIPLSGLPVRGMQLGLLEWSRAAELSCDRAAALEADDPMVVCRMLMRMAGGALEGMNVDAFVRQATRYTEEEDLFARRARFTYELGRTHPAAVRRVRELVTWIESGAYDRIRSGSFVKRGEEPPVSAEYDAAVRYYRERFTAMLDRTLGGINKLSEQIRSWLRRNDRKESEETDDDMTWELTP